MLATRSGPPCILVKTALGMESIVASRIEDLGLRARPSPMGFKGLVLVYECKSPEDDAKRIGEEVVEADKILVAKRVTRATLEDLAREASEAAQEFIDSSKCFAVRTTRRGRHPFTSIDVNVVVGEAVKKATDACVNLDYPDVVVAVEILGDMALIAFYPGSAEWRKMRPGKAPVTRLFEKISIVQMPYLGPLDACRNMGVRIGREVQNFEVKELVVAPTGVVDARQLSEFLLGVFEGIESRYEIQARSYHRRVRRVPVYIQDLHQLVRSRMREPIIVMEPEGEHVSRVTEDLWGLFKRGRRVNVLIGSREGIPVGVYRYADLVVDVAPGVTISTDYAAASALIALATVLHEKLLKETVD